MFKCACAYLHTHDTWKCPEEVLANDALVVDEAGHGGAEWRRALTTINLFYGIGVVHEKQVRTPHETGQLDDVAILGAELRGAFGEIRHPVLTCAHSVSDDC